MSKTKTFDATDVHSIRKFREELRALDETQVDENVLLFNINKIINELKIIDESTYHDKRIIKMLKLLSTLTYKSTSDYIIEAIAKSGIYQIYIKILNYELKQENSIMSLLNSILSSISSLTENSRNDLIEANNIKYNLFEIIVKIMKKEKFLDENNIQNDELFSTYVSITKVLEKNCRKNQKVKEKIVETGITNILIPDLNKLKALKNYTNVIKKTIMDLIIIIVSLLDEENVNKLDIMKSDIETIIACLEETINYATTNPKMVRGTKHYTAYFIGNAKVHYHAATLIDYIKKIARNDNIKKVIFECNIFEHLRYFLKNGTKEEVLKSCELICLLCFNQSVKSYLNEDKTIIKCVSTILQTTNDAETKLNCQQIIDMVEQSLEKRIATLKLSSLDTVTDNYIMISYSHAYKEKCVEINSELKSKGYKTWIDNEHPITDLRDAMAKAVEGASIVLMCYSDEYKASGNCRYEAEYAANLNKKIIAVRMQPRYTPDGWLGLILSSKFYVDFTKTEPNPYDTLFRQIDALLKGNPINENTKKSPKNSSIDPKNWNCDQVKSWMLENNLKNLSKVFKKYTGLTLKSLWQIKKNDFVGFTKEINNVIEKSNIDVEDHEKYNFYELLSDLF